MDAPRHCSRCRTPLALESDGELCIDCRSATPIAELGASALTHQAVDGTASFRSSVILAPPRETPGRRDTTISDDKVRLLGPTVTNDLRFEQNVSVPSEVGPRRLPAGPPGYELVQRLGAGGMGDVFLARDLTTERDVAMKFLRAAANPVAVERFLTEVRALARLDHPNIVRVLSTDFYAACPFFTMEYTPAGTLADRVAASGPLAPEEAARLMATVARAVQAAHDARVLHRDLKPSNVLVAAGGAPKVADFGLAKRTDQADDLTLGSGPLGTPSFMPPEQVSRRHGTIGPASDVYSLGATLYYLLAGQPPFVGESSAEIASRVVADPPPRLRSVRPESPAGLEGIVAKCLEKSPAARYASATALADDLERFLAGERQHAPELTRWRRLRQWTRRQRVPLAAALAATVLAVTLVFKAPVPTADKSNPDGPSSLPADAVEDVRNELAANRSVILIGDTGLPKYWRTILEPVIVDKSPLGDKTCYFQAFKCALVELCPHPGIEHYRVDLQVRFVSRQEEGSWVGVYFGYSSNPLTTTAIGHLMHAVTFKDWLPPADPSGKQPLPAAWLGSTTIVQNSEKLLEPRNSRFAGINFTPSPADGTAYHWRPISIEVSPSFVLARWEDDKTEPDGSRKMKAIKHPTREYNPWKVYDDAKKNMLELFPGSTHPHRWGPDMPFGLISYRAAVSVRNVVVTPLP